MVSVRGTSCRVPGLLRQFLPGRDGFCPRCFRYGAECFLYRDRICRKFSRELFEANPAGLIPPDGRAISFEAMPAGCFSRVPGRFPLRRLVPPPSGVLPGAFRRGFRPLLRRVIPAGRFPERHKSGPRPAVGDSFAPVLRSCKGPGWLAGRDARQALFDKTR